LKAGLARDFAFLTADDADRIARAYGTRARSWLERDQGRDFGGGLRQAEVDYLVAEEWAVSAEDVLWRRTKLGLRLSEAQAAGLKEYLGS
jgi:glycerol-3-phosphate dehydrogenase